LGQDVFTQGSIGQEKTDDLIDAMIAFQKLMKIHHVIYYKAAATSAFREAQNGNEIVQLTEERSGIKVEIIDGKKEAQFILNSQIENPISKASHQIYIDVGGGSTELSLIENSRIIAQKSFDIGGVRILAGKVSEENWIEMKTWIKENTKSLSHIDAIGTGGNINKVHHIFQKKDDKPVNYSDMDLLHQKLENMSIEERMHEYQLKHDRADVIVPALKIYLSVMKWANTKIIYVPKVGMADGLIKLLHQEILG
jgi:exopolyphosphatase/guanosine-5'-triphosphate,3'-diphosphate pyrophosphatase